MNTSTRLCLLVLVLPLTVGVSNARSTAAEDPGLTRAAVPLPTITTILPPKEAEVLFKFYFSADHLFGKQDKHHKVKETFWMPSTAEVTQAEVTQAEADFAAYSQTPAHAASLKREGADHWPHPILVMSYFRQYAGVRRGDRKLILINGFDASYLVTPFGHQKDDLGWRNRAVLVYDGGFNFFQAVYDPMTHRVGDFTFNGFA